MEYIRPLDEQYQSYLKDESRSEGWGESISFPTSQAQVVEIVGHCHAQGLPITVQGARTGVAAGAVPHGGHVLNLSKLTAITSCQPWGDGFAFGVEPGLSLLALNKSIATKKIDTTGWDQASQQSFLAFLEAPEQFFPPDPTETTCSLGGMVSCNASGARSFLYGSVRNHIVGLEVVLSDGAVVSLRRGDAKAHDGKLVLTTQTGKSITVELPTYPMPKTKNASGYYVAPDMDGVDLFIGGDGTLGVVTHVTICTTPLPKEIWGVSCFFPSETAALAFVVALRQHPAHLSAVEYFDPHALDVLRSERETGTAFKQLPVISQEYHACVFCEIHAPDLITAQTTMVTIGQVMTQTHSDPAHSWVARNQGDLHLLQFFRHAVPESVNRIIDQRKQKEPVITKLGSDMSVPDQALKQVVALYKSTLEDAGLEHAIWGHIGNNHLHVNILPRNAQEYYLGKTLFQRWAVDITAMGGAVSAEHGVGKLKANFLEVMYTKAGIEQMRRVKKALDPMGLLGRETLFAYEEGGAV